MKNPTISIEDELKPFPKERRGYTKHFNEVYAPLMQKWVSKWSKTFGIDPAQNQPLAVSLVQMCPLMIRAIPTAELRKHRDELVAVKRLAEMGTSLEEQDWTLRWERESAQHGGMAFAYAMMLYRAGYSSVSFNFYGGGDEGSVDNIYLTRNGKNVDPDDVGIVDMNEFVYLVLPQGFGNDQPYYRDGEFSIDLHDLSYSLGVDVEVTKYQSVENEGVMWNGIDIPYPQD